MKKIAALLIGIVVLFAVAAHAQSTFQSYNRSVNILDYGCDPTGSADSTTCIQAAIDATYAAHYTTTYCPPGIYKTTAPLYLDPPGNLRAPAYLAGTTYALNATVLYAGARWISLGNGNVGNTPFNGSTHWSDNTDIHFSLAFVGPDGGMANFETGATPGCTIKPTFNNNVAFWVGPGNGMSVKSIQIHSDNPSNGYRGELPSAGRCIAVAGGQGGANRGLIQDIWCDAFYINFETGTNSDGLGAEIEFNRVLFSNCFIGVIYARTQNDINHVTNSDNGGCTTAIKGNAGRPVNIWGGNMSTSGIVGKFSISSTSALTAAACAENSNINCYTLTTTIASPDTHINGAYNSYMLRTAHFGVVPMELTNWNSGTSVATFRLYYNWTAYHFQISTNAKTSTDLEAEIQAVGTLYATERVTVFDGPAFHVAGGTWMENAAGCTTFVRSAGNGFNGDRGSLIERVTFNYDPSLYLQAGSSTANLAYFYCQQSFPFIDVRAGGGNITFDTVDFDQSSGPGDPIIIDIDATSTFQRVIFRGTPAELVNPVVRTTGVYLYGGGGPMLGGNASAYTPGLGGAEWDQSPFRVSNSAAGSGQLQAPYYFQGTSMMPFVGFRPAPWATARLTPALFTTLSSITGSNALGSYPLVNGGTLYSTLNPYTGANASGKLFATSQHIGWSYGQNLTTTNVGAGLSWNGKGQAIGFNLDVDSMSWMMPGLGIKMNTSANTHYIITGVYPTLGWITVINAEQDGTPFLTAGTKTTTYTGTLIGQDAYSWTQYP